MSRSARQNSLLVAAGLACALLAVPGARAQPQNGAGRAVMPGIPALACAPGDTRPACQARRMTIQPNQPVAPRLLRQDMPGQRFIPPKITAFLADPRVEPLTRAFLQRMAGKPTDDWTLAELEMVTSLVPTLTELHIPTAVLSDFYEFLGLDPTQLFTPQLGPDWQQRSTSLDARNLYAAERSACYAMLGVGGVPDLATLTLGQLAACNTGEP